MSFAGNLGQISKILSGTIGLFQLEVDQVSIFGRRKLRD
jgi:hypothetical protein